MSTFKELSNSKLTVLIAPKYSVVQSTFKSLVFFSMLAFCIYISKGSTWWTFVTGGLFLFVLLLKIGDRVNKSTTLNTKAEAIKFIEDSNIKGIE